MSAYNSSNIRLTLHSRKYNCKLKFSSRSSGAQSRVGTRAGSLCKLWVGGLLRHVCVCITYTLIQFDCRIVALDRSLSLVSMIAKTAAAH